MPFINYQLPTSQPYYNVVAEILHNTSHKNLTCRDECTTHAHDLLTHPSTSNETQSFMSHKTYQHKEYILNLSAKKLFTFMGKVEHGGPRNILHSSPKRRMNTALKIQRLGNRTIEDIHPLCEDSEIYDSYRKDILVVNAFIGISISGIITPLEAIALFRTYITANRLTHVNRKLQVPCGCKKHSPRTQNSQ